MKQSMRWKWTAALVVISALLISACAANTDVLQPATSTPKPTADRIQDTEPETAVEPEQPTETDPSVAVGEPMDTPESTDAGIPEPELGFEYGDPNLKATAPRMFVRASGMPQMVELFAFW